MEDNTKSAVYTDEIVYDGGAEQGVELDYVLPDYCPDIFKILSCTLSPKIVSYNISGDCKLNMDGVVYIKVLYMTENSSDVYCIDQHYTYSKTVDMSRKNMPDTTPEVSLSMKSDYCNCRAVSPRRIDVRGAVSCRIKAFACVEYALPELPENLQVKTVEVNGCGKTLSAKKQIIIREEIETGSDGIAFIMQSSAVPKVTDLRVIADKVVLKGTVAVSALYGIFNPESGGASQTEKMTADIPISAILDVDGISDDHQCFPEISIMNFELIPKSDSGILSCEILAECEVHARIEEQTFIATDIYSTEYETDFTANTLKIAANPRIITENIPVRTNLTCDKGDIHSVWDVSGELKNAACRPNDDGKLVLTGLLCVSAYGVNTDGVPFNAEKQENIEERISVPNINPDTVVYFDAVVSDTGFSIKSDGTLDVSSTIAFNAEINNVNPISAVKEVTVYEDRPRDRSDEFALRICYTDDSSDCWSIAKRCGTTVEAIMAENDIESCDEPLSGMIIIPTV